MCINYCNYCFYPNCDILKNPNMTAAFATGFKEFTRLTPRNDLFLGVNRVVPFKGTVPLF